MSGANASAIARSLKKGAAIKPVASMAAASGL